MKNRKIAALVLVFILVLTMAGCGTKTESITDVFASVQENLKAVKSSDATMKMDMTMSAQGQEVSMQMNTDMQIMNDPVRIKAVSKVDMGLGTPVESETYLTSDNDLFTTYTKINGQWAKEEMDKAAFNSLVEQLMNGVSASPYVQNSENFEASEDKEVNGTKVSVYKGAISGDYMEEALSQIGVLDQLAVSEINESIFQNIKDIQVTLYVDKKSKLPVQIDIDVQEFMKTAMEAAFESYGQEVDVDIIKCDMSILYNSFNSVESIDVPEEALNS